MLRHPIYLLLCLSSVVYLATADARGWSLLRSLTSVSSARTNGARGYYGGFNHK